MDIDTEALERAISRVVEGDDWLTTVVVEGIVRALAKWLLDWWWSRWKARTKLDTNRPQS